RLAMCEALCRDTSGWMRAVDVERHVPGEGRTVDTLEHLARTRPDVRVTLVIGSDLLPDLPSWKAFPRIQELARVLVVNRAGYPDPHAVGPPLAEVSSTAVREALERGEEPVGLVPRVVLEYLRTHRLYAR
ncbi:MAG: nicotinate-nicotinamide nucleotide adenylyltransferase, partial [Myxococcaceae bacterium]|nr:nicotinate-nicotinamide nucleotide adenylyltransferase [Myxococcaceae bacterium]